MQSNSELEFNQLSEEQKEKVLELIGICNIEDFDVAIKIMKMCNFQIDKAVPLYMEKGPGALVNNQSPPKLNTQASYNSQGSEIYSPSLNNQNSYRSSGSAQEYSSAPPLNRGPSVDTGLVNDYKKFLQDKERENSGLNIKRSISGITDGIKKAWNSIIPTAIRGESPGGEQFICFLKRQVPGETLQFKSGHFEENLHAAHTSNRPLLIYIHQNNSPRNQLALNLLVDKELINLCNTKFLVLGLLSDSEDSQQLAKFIPRENWPCFGLFRYTLFEKIDNIGFIPITEDKVAKDYINRIKNLFEDFYMLLAEENKIKTAATVRPQPNIHFNPHFNPFAMNDFYSDPYYSLPQQQPARPQISQAQREKIEQDRLLRQMQEEEFKLTQKKAEEQMLKKQEEELKKQLKIEEEKLKEKKKQEELLAKKQAVKNEPEANDPNAVVFAIRMPDGKRIMRRFLSSQEAKEIYDWLETGDFGVTGKEFDLVQSHPPLNLTDKINNKLSDLFPGSKQEMLIFREK